MPCELSGVFDLLGVLCSELALVSVGEKEFLTPGKKTLRDLGWSAEPCPLFGAEAARDSPVAAVSPSKAPNTSVTFWTRAIELAVGTSSGSFFFPDQSEELRVFSL